jgi:hypothetical protein
MNGIFYSVSLNYLIHHEAARLDIKTNIGIAVPNSIIDWNACRRFIEINDSGNSWGHLDSLVT